MQGEDVADVLNDIWAEEPFTFLQTDNGPEFRSSAVQNWCKNHAVTQVFQDLENRLITALLNHSTELL